MVSDISVEPYENYIQLSWKLPSTKAMTSIKSLLIFKSDFPITQDSLSSEQKPIASLQKTENKFLDDTSTKNSYYAVIAQYSDGLLYDVIIPSVNSTIYGVDFKKNDKKNNSSSLDIIKETEDKLTQNKSTISTSKIREAPLPYLHLLPISSDCASVVDQKNLETAEKLGRVYTTNSTITPYIFPQDNNKNSTGDDYSLYTIIETNFKTEQWISCIKELEIFLQTNHELEVTARTKIYLGQALFFCQKYREALTYFLSAEPKYQTIAKRWIQTTLNAMSLPDGSNKFH